MRFFLSLIFLLFIIPMHSQEFTGRVVNTEYDPVAGANVYWQDTGIGTATDEQGIFKIQFGESASMNLIISFLGYEPKIILVKRNDDPDLATILLENRAMLIPELTVSALRAAENQPFAFQNWNKEEINERNQGRDIPFIIQHSPSMVVTSDAGNGIGYTGLRIRGSDQSRINVTINGIPYNDSESQQVFWVDLPDFSSGLQSLQIQRGLGTSTNGAGAFGGSIHLNTLDLKEESYISSAHSRGSYNTRKHNLALGTGLLNERFTFDARISTIQSNGYIDRASSNLNSLQLSGSYLLEKGSLHAMIFKGSEITYQSWYGTPQSRLENDEAAMINHAQNNGLSSSQLDNLLNSDRRYNFYTYDNQVDDYNQDHYQIHFHHKVWNVWNLKTSLHLTKGNGFFEQYREDDSFSDYGLEDPMIGNQTISSGDFIRRRFLDNDFYGLVWELGREFNQSKIDIGGSLHEYKGDHFGEIIWSEIATNHDIRERYYSNRGEKDDANIYAKYSRNDFMGLDLYFDLQLRHVDYKINGIDNDLRSLRIDSDYLFFNPKLGFSYPINLHSSLYASFGIGNREPDRNDFVDSLDDLPEHESMRDLELGWKYDKGVRLELNAYWMDYTNQLVLTGELNDVGAPLRENVANSHRLGLEFLWGAKFFEKLGWEGSVNISENKIDRFVEIVYDYSTGFDIQENEFENTNISFSPSFIGSNIFSYDFNNQMSARFYSKFVSQQFLDNSQNDDRAINAFFVNDFSLNYQWQSDSNSGFEVSFSIFNVFNEKYSANGYTFSYIFGDLITENFYYPQAERNFMLGFSINI